ncbi:MAG: polysaccharide lyase [Dehalococcoidia bacterium]|nr:polysaccharide lyase [Dehalococcoidia bacterium]
MSGERRGPPGDSRVGRLCRRRRSVLLIAALGAALLACGSDRTADSASSEADALATTAAVTPSAASAAGPGLRATPTSSLSVAIDPDRLPREITAVMLRQVTYEVDEMLAETDAGSHVTAEFMQAVDDGLRTTSETARRGAFAGEALLRSGDPQYRGRLGYRAEWQSEFHAERDQEYWYSASYYIPEDWDQGRNQSFNDRIIFQFHEGTAGSPAFSLHLTDESRFMMRRKRSDDRFQYLWSHPFETDRWYDFVFHAKWTRDDDGFFRIYFNQELVQDYQGRTLPHGSSVYTKWGIYGQPTHVLFDEVRIVAGEQGLRLASPWPVILQ